MEIGNVIRKYRKEKNLTQEEMAGLLGVTAPAVNKWEKGNSMPDVTLLAPIARLLDITLDTLLSFHRELTDIEIRDLLSEINMRLENMDFDKAFQWAKEQLQLYPDCEQLILRTAQSLYAHRIIKEEDGMEKYDNYIVSYFCRALKSESEDIKNSAADSLFGFFMRKEQYDRAEEYLEYFKQNPDRKLKQAGLYIKTNRIKEAYKLYEELLFGEFQIVYSAFNGIYTLAVMENDMDKAHTIVDKSKALSAVFDMGRYYETAADLELAVEEKDTDMVIETMKSMLDSVSEICSYCNSSLYEHIKLRRPQKEFYDSFKKRLIEKFSDNIEYDFLQHDIRYQRLIKQ